MLNVAETDRVKLLELLQRYNDCFANDLTNLGCTDAAEMEIELTSEKPVVYRPYRSSHHEWEKVRTMICEILKAGIIKRTRF